MKICEMSELLQKVKLVPIDFSGGLCASTYVCMCGCVLVCVHVCVVAGEGRGVGAGRGVHIDLFSPVDRSFDTFPFFLWLQREQ